MPRQKKTNPSTQERISISHHFEEGVQEMADYYGLDKIDIMTRAFERGYPLIYRDYVKHREQVGKMQEGAIVRMFLLRLANGEPVEDVELGVIAHDAGVNVEVIKKVRDCLKRNGGAKSHVVITS